jgi:TPP-dependent pyruvate/acetoin dehydrogenase alpha subunit
MPVSQPKCIDLPGAAPRLSNADLLSAYATMLRVRRFEEKAAQLYAIGVIDNLPALAIGQEAILAAAVAAVTNPQSIRTVPPMAGLKIAQGHAPRDVIAELMQGVIASSGTIAAAGIDILILDPGTPEAERNTALKAALSQSRGLVLIVINANTDVSEALNLNVAQSAVCAEAKALGIDAQVTDGNDIERLRFVIDTALSSATVNNTLHVVEAMLHRYRGHGRGSQPNAKPSLPREAIDPLARTRHLLVSSGSATTDQVTKLEQIIRDDVTAGVAEARGLVAAAADKI